MRESKFKRKCIGCNKLKNKDELIKITSEKMSGKIVVNPSTLQFGRSAYICKDKECVNSALKKDRLFKVLKTHSDDFVKNEILSLLDKS